MMSLAPSQWYFGKKRVKDWAEVMRTLRVDALAPEPFRQPRLLSFSQRHVHSQLFQVLLQRRPDEVHEQRVRVEGRGGELRVKLARHEPGTSVVRP